MYDQGYVDVFCFERGVGARREGGGERRGAGGGGGGAGGKFLVAVLHVFRVWLLVAPLAFVLAVCQASAFSVWTTKPFVTVGAAVFLRSFFFFCYNFYLARECCSENRWMATVWSRTSVEVEYFYLLIFWFLLLFFFS